MLKVATLFVFYAVVFTVQSAENVASIDNTVAQGADAADFSAKQPVGAKGTWSDWSDWSVCTKKCGGGIQEQTRSCIKAEGELDCDGESARARNCNTHTCDPQGCELVEDPAPGLSSAPAITDRCNNAYFKLWYPLLCYLDSTEPERMDFETCFLKVKLPSADETYKVQAVSIINDPDNPLNGEQYGKREDCNGDKESAVCIEVRPPSVSACSYMIFTVEWSTKVNISVISHSSLVDEINPDIAIDTPSKKDDKVFQVDLFNGAGYTSYDGIYCARGKSQNEAVSIARNLCKNSSDDDSSEADHTDDKNYAVKFA